MKNTIILFLLAIGLSLSAQETKKVLHQAMEQEISRNMTGLQLEGMKNPFYIGLNILDLNVISIQSSLGSLIRLGESPGRYTLNNKVLVGDFANNNLNFVDQNSSSYYLRTLGQVPLDNSIQEVQRKLWLSFDRGYKLSAEIYESKQSALKSKTQDEDVVGVPDYTASEKVLIDKPEIQLKYSNDKLVQYANEISASLKSYKYLSSSWVRILGFKANVYYSNSEGSKATYPTSLMRIVVCAETQAPNGEVFELYQVYCSLNETDLPAKDLVIKDAKILAETLSDLKNAPVFDDVYNGPVLFEDQAASEAVRKTMFYARNENLFSFRKQVVGGAGMEASNKVSTDDRIDKKVSVEGLTVKAKSLLTEYNGIPLVGAYPIDMDGVVPAQETSLIENGILKNMLCGRVPTAKMKASNGHVRVPLGMPVPTIVPGVIEVDFANSVSKEDLKKKLIEMAQAEGLDYALIVREMTSNMSELKKVYKVDLKTGAEQLVRSAGFKGLMLSDLRKIVGAGNRKTVLNTTSGEDIIHKATNLNGCPATFITPDAFLFKEIEVSKQTKPNMTKLPVVKNPLEL